MPADWPSSGAADSQAPRWAASLSRSAADAAGVTADSAATIAAMPAMKFTCLMCSIAAPVLLAKRGTFALEVATKSRLRHALSANRTLIARMDRVFPSVRQAVSDTNAAYGPFPRSQHR